MASKGPRAAEGKLKAHECPECGRDALLTLCGGVECRVEPQLIDASAAAGFHAAGLNVYLVDDDDKLTWLRPGTAAVGRGAVQHLCLAHITAAAAGTPPCPPRYGRPEWVVLRERGSWRVCRLVDDVEYRVAYVCSAQAEAHDMANWLNWQARRKER